MTTATTAHTVQSGHTAPNGQAAVKATCHCTVCNGRSAIVRTAYADEHHIAKDTKAAYTHVHNLVQMAHGPLRFAPQVQANGPWAA